MAQINPDLSEFDALERLPHPTRCKMARAMDTLTAQDLTNLNQAILEGRSNLLIARWFNTKGHHLNDQTIAKHRRGDCVCR